MCDHFNGHSRAILNCVLSVRVGKNVGLFIFETEKKYVLDGVQIKHTNKYMQGKKGETDNF